MEQTPETIVNIRRAESRLAELGHLPSWRQVAPTLSTVYCKRCDLDGDVDPYRYEGGVFSHRCRTKPW